MKQVRFIYNYRNCLVFGTGEETVLSFYSNALPLIPKLVSFLSRRLLLSSPPKYEVTEGILQNTNSTLNQCKLYLFYTSEIQKLLKLMANFPY